MPQNKLKYTDSGVYYNSKKLLNTDDLLSTALVYDNNNSNLPATSVQTAIDELDANVDDILTSIGTTVGQLDLGSFTGTIIPDNSTVKSAFQTVETYLQTSSFSKWTNDNPNTLVKLTNLSNGSTARPAGAEFVIKDSGNIGIGNTSPNNKLEITHGTNGNSGLRFTNLNSTNTPGTANGKVLSVDTNGDVVLLQGPAASLPFYQANGTNSGTTATRDLNDWVVSKGTSIIATDVAAVPTNVPNGEGAWFEMGIQSVSAGYYGQFLLNDHAAYFRGGSVGTITANDWRTMPSFTSFNKFTFNVGAATADSNMTLMKTGAFALAFGTNNLERMRIDAAGNVGVGSVGPTAKLEVTGNVKISTRPDQTNVVGKKVLLADTASNEIQQIDYTALGKIIGVLTNSTVAAETIIAKFTIPANAISLAYLPVQIKGYAQVSATATLIYRVRIGINGTTADALAGTFTTTAAGAANAHTSYDILVTPTTVGAAGVFHIGGAVQLVSNRYSPATAVAVTATVNTTVVNYISITVQQSIAQTYTSKSAILLM